MEEGFQYKFCILMLKESWESYHKVILEVVVERFFIVKWKL